MDWHDRYKIMKKELKFTNSDIAEITGHTSDSIRVMTNKNKEFPRSLRLAIVIYERLARVDG